METVKFDLLARRGGYGRINDGAQVGTSRGVIDQSRWPHQHKIKPTVPDLQMNVKRKRYIRPDQITPGERFDLN